MNKAKLSAAVAATMIAMGAAALNVENTAGRLHTLVTDTDVTTLTVTGTLNEADLCFIATELPLLESLDISGATVSGNTLPNGALIGSPVQTVVLPATLEAIGYGSFAGCTRLSSITLPSSLTAIGERAFTATGLTAINVPATVATVGAGAFAHCAALSTAELHCAALGDEAFKDAALTTLTVGSELQSIGAEAFAGTSLTSVDLSPATSLTTIGDYAFTSSTLATAVLPDGVALGKGAFLAATALTTATAPMTEVPELAFALTALTAGDIVAEGTTTIGDRAFYGMSGNVDVFNLPASLTTVGTEAFAGATGIKQFEIAATAVPAVGADVWAGIDQPNVNLGTPSNAVASLYKEAEQWQDFHVLWEYLMGDVNDDTHIDVGDITATASRSLGQMPPVFVFEAADVNDDKIIDVSDVSGVANYAVKGIETNVRKTKRLTANNYPTTTDAVTVAPALATAGTLTLRMENSTDYAAVQCDITLPEGMTIAERGINSQGRAVAWYTGENGVTRLAVYSVTNIPFEAGINTVATIDVVDGGALLADASIEVDNVIMADTDNKTWLGRGGATRIGTITAVNDVDADGYRVSATAGAIIIDATVAGKAIVTAINGISRSVSLAAGRNVVTDLPAAIYIVTIDGRSHKVVVR